jgi:alpha-mannosidase
MDNAIMAIQVNTRLEESDWEKVVEAMPGLSNGERMSQLVRQQLIFFDSRRNLTRALELMENTFSASLQALQEQRLQGKGSDLTEMLAQTVNEMAALILSHTGALSRSPGKTLPELEAALVRRWSQTTLQILRLAALDPSFIRNPQAVQPELRRVFEQARLLQPAPSPAS